MTSFKIIFYSAASPADMVHVDSIGEAMTVMRAKFEGTYTKCHVFCLSGDPPPAMHLILERDMVYKCHRTVERLLADMPNWRE